MSKRNAIRMALWLACAIMGPAAAPAARAGADPGQGAPLVLHAARLLDVAGGRTISPGEVLVEGERITAVGASVQRPAGARVVDLGDATLMPGLIDVHVHLFLHPGAEDLQTVVESVPKRTIIALMAARDDLMAGYTSERDMGTEGAGSADSAVRDAINEGLAPGPRLRVSGNAIDILGGHEDANRYNPAQHVLSNASYANDAAQLVEVIRQQRKEGSDFVKIYESGKDSVDGNDLHAPYQYTVEQLRAAIAEAARTGTDVATHATSDPAAHNAAEAGVVSIEHATQLGADTMRLMKEKGIPAVPTFAVYEYFAEHAATPEASRNEHAQVAIKVREFRRQLAAGVPMAVGSDVGPFPHGTQAREYLLMGQHGMPAADVLRAGLVNGARLMGLAGQVGELKAGYLADIIAVPGDPLADLGVLAQVRFVMKGGAIVREH